MARVVMNATGDAVLGIDTSGRLTYVNKVAQRLLAREASSLYGVEFAEACRIYNVDSKTNLSNLMAAVEAAEWAAPNIRGSVLVRSDGAEVPIEYSLSPLYDPRGVLAGAVFVFRDLSESLAMTERMSYLAHHDFLTDLPNRMLLNDRLSQCLVAAERHNRRLAILFLDLDGFKLINDSLGHSIGDELLKEVAQRLMACVRRSDTVSRQGGDEFVVLLSEVELSEDTAITAKKILQAVALPHSIDQHDLHVTASIGLSVYPDDGLDTDTLIKNADTAMYQAKENGRQGFQFFKPAMNARAVERQFIEEGLRRALERQEFELHYQPKVNLTSGAITGAEALIRWLHPTRGLVSPIDFIPVAEDCGLILPIGAWVLHEACRQAQAWMDRGLPAITMAVNVSAMEFRDKNFLAGLMAILAETGFDPRSLELELTESVLMKHAASTAIVLQTLRESGIRVAVDDFGTGYSSLSYLQKFPIDAVKIDQSFIRQISTAGDDTTIVKAVIGMARGLKLRVVAEGVETAEEVAFLRAYRCEEAQGYFFGRPVPAQQFVMLLKNGMPKSNVVNLWPPVMAAAEAS